jgi:Tol biopolymer transport system component
MGRGAAADADPRGRHRCLGGHLDEPRCQPDGRTLVFDLLGDIYTMPASGGAATRIAEGLPYEVQPRFSPDGRLIAFTSDRGGGDNIWVMDRDGSNKRQVTKETFETLNNPSWSADGRYIAARKHLTTTRSLGTGEIWLYHLGGGGSGVALVQRPNPQHQKELGEPTFTPKGDAIYFTRNTTSGPIFEYAEDSNQAIYAIERYDMATGERSTVAAGVGGAVRPAPSPDGKWLAFVRRERAKSKLYVKDLRSGEERKIYDDLDQDMQETWAVQGLYPNMDWTPDSRAIFFWAGGKIRRVGADGSGAAEVPFRIADSRTLVDPPRFATEVAPDSFTTRSRASPRYRPTGGGWCGRASAACTSRKSKAARRGR